jgi:hypothetical protein
VVNPNWAVAHKWKKLPENFGHFMTKHLKKILENCLISIQV